MQLELTTDEQLAVFVLAGGELQAIKAEEEIGEPIDTQEVEVLLALMNKTNPKPEEGSFTWENIPPYRDEPEIV